MDMGVSVSNVSLGKISQSPNLIIALYSLAKCNFQFVELTPFWATVLNILVTRRHLLLPWAKVALSFLYAFAYKISSCSTALTMETCMLQKPHKLRPSKGEFQAALQHY